ncbi:hypothetical protein [Sphingobium sp. Sx8-8]|uniref:hypothetical protein n=1 Tax=Sphingobium sp. Sx8-8 TaxID=2933617 RepID=UPI001F5ABD2C|nr:hypothetical protein [Sphingobium sp. Sx8-8]
MAAAAARLAEVQTSADRFILATETVVFGLQKAALPDFSGSVHATFTRQWGLTGYRLSRLQQPERCRRVQTCGCIFSNK